MKSKYLSASTAGERRLGGSTPNYRDNATNTPTVAFGDSPLSEGACFGRDTSQKIDHEVALVGVLGINFRLGKWNPMVHSRLAGYSVLAVEEGVA